METKGTGCRFWKVFLTLLFIVLAVPVNGMIVKAQNVPIDETHFPDKNFRNRISTYYDSDKDNVLSESEAAKVKMIEVSNWSITSLKGIEYFLDITTLYCYNNKLTSLDISKNTKLKYLSCEINNLVSLDLGSNTELIEVKCDANMIRTLDVSKNTLLEKLQCDTGVQVTGIDESKIVRKDNPNLMNPTIEEKPSETEEQKQPTVGSTVSVDSGTYKVTDIKKAEVTYVAPNVRTSTEITIPENVEISDKRFKVTKIADNAFKNNKKLIKITIGKNITSIGKNAFNGCKKLKNITIKSTKLKKIGKNALKNINKKAIIKVPKNKLKAYKKLLKGKGQKSSVKIKK